MLLGKQDSCKDLCETGFLFNSAEVTSLLHIGETFCGKFSVPHCSCFTLKSTTSCFLS